MIKRNSLLLAVFSLLALGCQEETGPNLKESSSSAGVAHSKSEAANGTGDSITSTEISSAYDDPTFPYTKRPPVKPRDTSKATQFVNVDDICKSVELVGRLGQPLGIEMTIRGKWSYPKFTKDNNPRFTISEVNGRALDKPIEFNMDQLSISTNDSRHYIPDDNDTSWFVDKEWEIVAYEYGTLYQEAFVTSTHQAPAAPYYTRPFTSTLTGVLKKEL